MTAPLLLFVILCSLPLVIILSFRYLDALSWRRSLIAYKLSLPNTLTAEIVASWLMTVNASTHAHWLSVLPAPPVALEVVGTARGIEHYLLVPKSMQAAALSGLRARLAGVRVEEAPDYLAHRPRFTVAAEAGLSNHRRPLHGEAAGTASAALLAALQPLYGAEEVRVQWILTGGGIPAPVRSVSASGKGNNGLWFADAVSIDPEAVHAARQKLEAPIIRAAVRVGIAGTRNRKRAYSLFGQVWATLRTINATGAGVVRRWWLPEWLVARRIAGRAVSLLTRWPLTLNTQELTGLLGMAVAEAHLPGLSLGGARQLPPAPNLPTSGAVVGVSDYPGMQERRLAVHTKDRLQHMHIIGPTGTGKSTLMANLAQSDIEAGRGVVLIDPKGDLVEAIADRFPDKRKGGLIILDPSKTDRPIGCNPLAVSNGEHQRELAVDHVLHVFREIYADFWGPRTDDVLRTTLLTLVHLKALDGSAMTLCEVPAMLTNTSFRHAMAKQQVPEQVRPFWSWYERLKPADQLAVIGPVLNKLRAFTDRTAIRLMLGQSEGLDLSSVLNENKVLLISLAKGKLGQETAALLGALLLASLWQATLKRADMPAATRHPVMVYLDEFQDVLKLGAVGEMLAQARGLGLGLHLAHQHMHQLPREVAHDVLGTARSQVIFQLGQEDARTLARSVEPALTADDLMGLEAFTAVLRACVQGRTLPPATMTTLPLPAASCDGLELARASRERYGVPRKRVASALQARLRVPQVGNEFGRLPRRTA